MTLWATSSSCRQRCPLHRQAFLLGLPLPLHKPRPRGPTLPACSPSFSVCCRFCFHHCLLTLSCKSQWSRHSLPHALCISAWLSPWTAIPMAFAPLTSVTNASLTHVPRHCLYNPWPTRTRAPETPVPVWGARPVTCPKSPWTYSGFLLHWKPSLSLSLSLSIICNASLLLLFPSKLALQFLPPIMLISIHFVHLTLILP